ncbi:MAG TPA: hypothetical protein VFG60_00515 [Burkholderiaceae bacterium]|nr:hypothetical protein [Burkholderiaceae bacterium]
MHLQMLVVALLVSLCSVYVVWTLMPSTARRALARALLRWPLPEPFAARMRHAAHASAGGCHGCEHAAQVAPGGARPVKLHSRKHDR